MIDVLLDNNALSNLVTGGRRGSDWAGSAQGACRDAVSRGAFRFVGSLNVLEETLRAHDVAPDTYEEMRSVGDELIGRFWLWPLDERSPREVAQGGGLLPEATRFLPRTMRRDLFIRTIRNKESVAHITRDTANRFADFVRTETASRESVHAAAGKLVGGDDKTRRRQILSGFRAWWKERDVGDWVRDILEAGVSRGALDPASGKGWENPASLTPSAWHFVTFRMARIWLTAGEGRRIHEGDLYDAYHYSAGCYADLLVTDDKDFMATCGLIDDCPFSPTPLEGFIDTLSRDT